MDNGLQMENSLTVKNDPKKRPFGRKKGFSCRENAIFFRVFSVFWDLLRGKLLRFNALRQSDPSQKNHT